MPPEPNITLSDRARSFQVCEHCTYDFRTGEGLRSCSYGECPYLPDELDVWCPTCLYNFLLDDGNPACGDPPDCDFATEEAPLRVAAMRQWLALQDAHHSPG